MDQIIISVTDDAMGNIQGVADELARLGMIIDQVLPVTGIITGFCETASRGMLSQVKGVLSLENQVICTTQE